MYYKGAISFGLVYIPISLSATIRENDIGFNMLDKNTMSRVKYKKTCVDCGNKEVKNEDIVRGYEYQKDKYVVFTDDELEKLKTQSDKNITILQFVDLREVDPVFFDKGYYVIPSGADKAFSVLLKAMEDENKAGIAKAVFGTKDTLLLIRSSGGKMIVNTLFFDTEIQSAPEIKKTQVEIEELKLAKSLIDKMTKKFEPEKYKDEYNEKLKSAIQKKIASKKIVSSKGKCETKKIKNLVKALQLSLKDTKKSKIKDKKAKNEHKKEHLQNESKKL